MKCVKCKYNIDIRALQIDHIHGGGRLELEKFGSNYKMYKYINSLSTEELKSKYQCLCANCNFIKRYENNELRGLIEILLYKFFLIISMEKENYNKFKGLYSSEAWDYETPDTFFNPLNLLFNFTLDVAANSSNNKLDNYYSEEDNALLKSWETEGRWWMNPPWGRAYTKKTGYKIKDWMQKAVSEYQRGHEGVCIVSARTDTKWWQDWVGSAPYVWFPKGRVAFLREGGVKNQPNFPSACPIFIKELTFKQKLALCSKGMLMMNVIAL